MGNFKKFYKLFLLFERDRWYTVSCDYETVEVKNGYIGKENGIG